MMRQPPVGVTTRWGDHPGGGLRYRGFLCLVLWVFGVGWRFDRLLLLRLLLLLSDGGRGTHCVGRLIAIPPFNGRSLLL